MEEHYNKKKAKSYICINCNYSCIKKNHYDNHVNTKKHKEKINGENIIKNMCICGKKFNNRQGLYRHKKICDYKYKQESIKEPIKEPTQEPTNFQPNINMFFEIIKQNNEFKELMIQQNQLINKFMERENQTINNTINNNQTFNLKVFLNETCKDAMNVKDFLDNLNPTLDDLENVGEKGFVKGISDIILRNLRELEVTKRPIHCTDIKREIVYLKENNEWNKDDKDNSKMKELIKKVENKNFNNVFEWQRIHPDVMILDSPDYMKREILIEKSCEAVDKEDKVRGKVLKELLKEIHISH